MLAVYNEALRIMHERTGDARYLVPNAEERQLTWKDLLWLRHNSQTGPGTILFHLQRCECGIESAICHETINQRAEPFRRRVIEVSFNDSHGVALEACCSRC